MPRPPRHLARVSPREFSADWRARVSGPSEGRVLGSWRRFLGVCRDECVRLAHADDVPLLILPEDTCCRRCDWLPGNEPHTTAPDRPRPALLRQPAKAIGIPWIRVPSTVAAGARERIAPLRFPAGLPLTPPTRCPHGWGQSAFRALQDCRGKPASVHSHFERAGHLYNRVAITLSRNEHAWDWRPKRANVARSPWGLR